MAGRGLPLTWCAMKVSIGQVGIALILACTLAANVSNRSVDGDRCNRTVDIYQAISSPPVTERNRGRPVHCSYRIRIRPPRDDWVVFIRFTRMRIGQPSHDRQECIGGYVQIIDGYRDTNQSNRETAGYYCGEIESPKTFISETPHVKIVFHVDTYDVDSFMQFDADVEQHSGVPARYGQHFQLYPYRRGVTVPGTYCERVFQDCSPGRCFVQSPGFPGIYPRNLRCRYHLSVQQSLVGLDVTTFDVDGLRCDNLLMCFPRSLTTNPDDCPYDYVRVYDGPTEESPVIVTLCGRGRLKSNIIAAGSQMLVEFVTSPAGPLLNNGFHFKADDIYDAGESEALQIRNNSCIIERHLTDNGQTLFTNLRSWYPPNTTCSYKFYGSSESELISLEFLWFRVERVTLCEESLKLYDSGEPEASRIITKLCDMNRPQTEQPRTVYTSTGPAMIVDFYSRPGSLDGSSISYGFEVKKINIIDQENGHREFSCSRLFTPDLSISGSFTILAEDFNFSVLSQPVTCNYTFSATTVPQGRVNVSLYTPFLRMEEGCSECLSRDEGRIEIYKEGGGGDPSACLCQTAGYQTIRINSIGPKLLLSLHIPPEADFKRRLDTTSKQTIILQILYNFYRDHRCGPDRLRIGLQGSIRFPYLNPENSKSPDCITDCDEPVMCFWRLPLLTHLDLALRFEKFRLSNNCTTDYLLVNNEIRVCQTSLASSNFLLFKKEEISGSEISIEFRSSSLTINSLVLWWTHLKLLPPASTSDSLLSLGKDCEFLCASSLACLRKELVCNGVPNCPQMRPDGRFDPSAGDNGGGDEEEDLCASRHGGLKFYWWIMGFGLGLVACVVMCVSFSACKRCRNGRHRF